MWPPLWQSCLPKICRGGPDQGLQSESVNLDNRNIGPQPLHKLSLYIARLCNISLYFFTASFCIKLKMTKRNFDQKSWNDQKVTQTTRPPLTTPILKIIATFVPQIMKTHGKFLKYSSDKGKFSKSILFSKIPFGLKWLCQKRQLCRIYCAVAVCGSFHLHSRYFKF